MVKGETISVRSAVPDQRLQNPWTFSVSAIRYAERSGLPSGRCLRDTTAAADLATELVALAGRDHGAYRRVMTCATLWRCSAVARS